MQNMLNHAWTTAIHEYMTEQNPNDNYEPFGAANIPTGVMMPGARDYFRFLPETRLVEPHPDGNHTTNETVTKYTSTIEVT